jgi:hypothetical protein
MQLLKCGNKRRTKRMKEEEEKPRFVTSLDHEKTNALRLVMTVEITDLITKFPKSAEACSAALAALIYVAFTMAKAMWGVDQAVRAMKACIDIEAGKIQAKQQKN